MTQFMNAVGTMSNAHKSVGAFSVEIFSLTASRTKLAGEITFEAFICRRFDDPCGTMKQFKFE